MKDRTEGDSAAVFNIFARPMNFAAADEKHCVMAAIDRVLELKNAGGQVDAALWQEYRSCVQETQNLKGESVWVRKNQGIAQCSKYSTASPCSTGVPLTVGESICSAGVLRFGLSYEARDSGQRLVCLSAATLENAWPIRFS